MSAAAFTPCPWRCPEDGGACDWGAKHTLPHSCPRRLNHRGPMYVPLAGPREAP